jgi:hypothetical protein
MKQKKELYLVPLYLFHLVEAIQYNPSTERYLSPWSYEKVKIREPEGSSLIFLATAANEAPDEIPTNMPSCLAAFWAYSKASSWVTGTVPSNKICFQVIRNKTGANTLNFVRAGLSTSNNGTVGRFNGKNLQIGEFFFQYLGNTTNVSACAHTGNQVIQTLRKIV